MWTYRQATGELLRDGVLVSVGYAGRSVGKNNPKAQHVPNMGPLPCGFYTIGDPECISFGPDGVCPHCNGRDNHKHGPYVLRLTPDPENEMFGRAGFLMHADSIAHPGEASEGCMCQNKTTRSLVHASGDSRLHVVSGRPENPEVVS